MTSAIFDTHSFVKRLTAAGMPEPQAEILADEQFRLLHEQVATKADIADLRADIDVLRGEIDALRTEMRGEIEALKAEMRGEIDALRTEMRGEIGAVRADMVALERRLRDQLTVRLGGMIAASVIVLGAMVKLL